MAGVAVDFLVSMFRALTDLPGCMGRVLFCKVGGNHCRLRHVGWEQGRHGLTSRARETADPRALEPLL